VKSSLHVAVFLTALATPMVAQSILTTVAGGGTPISSGPALSVPIDPRAIAFDGSGNLFVADVSHERIVKINTSGALSVFAGTGTAGFSGDGGQATAARLNRPIGVVVDSAGNVYVLDAGNSRIRKVSTAGVISTVASNLQTPNDLFLASSGDLYVTEAGRVRSFNPVTGNPTAIAGTGVPGSTGNGGLAASAQVTPLDVAVDTAGNVFISEFCKIRRVDATTKIITGIYDETQTDGSCDLFDRPRDLNFTPTGVLIVAGQVQIFTLSGTTRTILAGGSHDLTLLANGQDARTVGLSFVRAVAFDPNGILHFAMDATHFRIWRVSGSNSALTAVAGDITQNFSGDGVATEETLGQARGVLVDPSNNVIIADSTNHRIRRLNTSSGLLTTIYGDGRSFDTGDNGPASQASVRHPVGFARDSKGNLYVALDENNFEGSKVRKIDGQTGVITTITCSTCPLPAAGSLSAIAVDTADNLLVSYRLNSTFGEDRRIRKLNTTTGAVTVIAGTGTRGYSGDGGPASAAQVDTTAIAVDKFGNIFLGESFRGVRIRKIDAATGIITTVAGNGIYGNPVDGAIATETSIENVVALVIDPIGDIIFAHDDARIYKVVAATGRIFRIAGGGSADPGDNGDPKLAKLEVRGLALDKTGQLYVAGGNQQRVRKISNAAAPVPVATCEYTLSSIKLPSPAAGRSGSVTLTTADGCGWSATSNATWIHVNDPTSGTGATTINFTIAPNPSSFGRTGTISISGRTFTVIQAGVACSYSISPGTASFPAAGGTGIVDVGAPEGCTWTAMSNVPWVTISSGASGSGSGKVNYSVSPNTTTSPRATTITVAGETFGVSQVRSGSTFSCAVGDVIATNVRTGGITELIPDLTITCSGTPPVAGIVGDIVVTLDTNLTSRLLSESVTEAVLLLNSPTTPALGINAFRGQIIGYNSVRWAGIPLAASATTTLRLTNIRARAADLAAGSSIRARVDLKTQSPVPLLNATQTVATAQPAAAVVVGSATPGPAASVTSVLVNFAELFSTAFKKQSSGGTSESGFIHGNLGNSIGVASNGTRLAVRLSNIPAGANVYAFAPAPDSSTRLISSNSAGAGGTPVVGDTVFGGTSYRKLSVANERTTAAWEVFAPATGTDNLTFQLLFENATPPQIDLIRQTMAAGLAPVSGVEIASSTAPIPRFRDKTVDPKVINLRIISIPPLNVSATATKAPGTRGSFNAADPLTGSNARFRYRVVNDSSETATDVVVRGNTQPGFNYAACSRSDNQACSNSSTELTENFGTIPPNGTAEIQVEVAANSSFDGSFIENGMSVAGQEIDSDLNSNTANSSVPIENCAGPLSPSKLTFAPTQSSGTITFPACAYWTVQNQIPWITITSPLTGSGSGNVSFNVAQNDTNADRIGTFKVAGLDFEVTQAKACSFALDRSEVLVPLEGTTSASFNVTTGASCSYTVQGDPRFPWLVVTPRSFQGTANVTFRVDPNPPGSPERVGTFTLAGKIATVRQAGTACTFSLAFNNDTVGSSGQRKTVKLTASPESCRWTASSSEPWEQVFPLDGTGSRAVEYNTFPNFSSGVRTATLTIAGRPFTVTQSAGPGTKNNRLVRLAYFNFLSRLPSPSEEATQSAVLDAGAPRGEFIKGFYENPEFNLGGRFVAGLYVGILDRDAEYGGWQFQRSALASGGIGQTKLVSNFINSVEYNLKFPNTTPQQYVILLYEHVLLREPAPAEVEFHVSTSLTPDTNDSRVELARRFLNANEFRTGTGTRLSAFLLYATLLQRDATPSERDALRARIAAGVPILTLINEFVGKPEFDALVN
jgi:sugar lactone lactonase YvrE